MNYHLDFETYSEPDLNSVGVYRYARDPSCEVLCLAISRGHEKPLLWVPPAYQHQLSFIDPMEQMEALEMLNEMMADEANLVYAHNANFEYVIWNEVMVKQHGFSPLRPEQMRCTALMARRACIPPSLGKCAAYLNLAQQKDARGSTLIRKFCIPQKPDKTHAQTWRRFPQDDPALFKEFCEYCIQDVVTEQAIEKALKLFDFGGISHTAFVSDLRINDMGLPVDIAALQTASHMIDDELARVRDEFAKITGLNPTQTGAFLIWMRERGYQGTDLRAATMDEALEEGEVGEDGIADEDIATLDDLAREALALRRVMSFAATKKIRSMLNVAGPDDNRVRGTLLCHGTSTGRWSSKLVQVQNMKKGDDHSASFFRDLRKGLNADTLELIHGPSLGNLANSIRHFINDGDSFLLVSDYNAIESRIANWISGQEDALEEYRNGVDRYRAMASVVYGVPPASASKQQRFLGKGLILGAGYQMGASKFRETCEKQGVEISEEMAQQAIKAFRKKHNKLTKFWYDMQAACESAVQSPGQKFVVGRIKAFTLVTAGIRFLMIRLPSGRHLAYPRPEYDSESGLSFHGQLFGKATWGRVSLYGGKIVENICQAIAADVMTIGISNSHEAGFDVIATVHDEIVCTTRGCTLSLERLNECLLDMPPWAGGLPLAVEGGETEFYSK
jgi:DNA polymerase